MSILRSLTPEQRAVVFAPGDEISGGDDLPSTGFWFHEMVCKDCGAEFTLSLPEDEETAGHPCFECGSENTRPKEKA